MCASYYGVVVSKRKQSLYIIVKIPVFVQIIPVQPGQFIVLAVSIIIAVLGIQELITRKEHGGTEAQ